MPVHDAPAFRQLLTWEIKRGARYRRSFTLLRLGVDPGTGASLSKGAVDATVVTVLRESLRDVDLIARLGPGEFGVLLPETSVSLISPVFQRLMDALVAQAAASGWPMTFSVGAVTWKEADVTSDYLLNRAQELLVHARRDSARVVEHEVLV